MSVTRFRRVLVPVKSRQKGLPPAAYHARVLAGHFGATDTVMCTAFDSDVAMRLDRDPTAAAAQVGLLDAERVCLERLASSMRDWGVEVETLVRWHAPVYEAVLDVVRERRIDLVALDALEPRPALHTRLMDSDWQLMRLCPVPLLFVNDPGFASYETVVAAVDPLHLGDAAEATDRAVLGAAAEFARAFRAELRALHAYPDPERYPWVTAVEVEPGVFFGMENLEAAHRSAALEAAAAFGIDADRVAVRAGDPRDVLLDAVSAPGAKKLLVLGALERGALEQAMLGSTAEAVIAEAACDVLLVKPERVRLASV